MDHDPLIPARPFARGSSSGGAVNNALALQLEALHDAYQAEHVPFKLAASKRSREADDATQGPDLLPNKKARPDKAALKATKAAEAAAANKIKKKDLQQDNKLVASRRDTLNELQLEISTKASRDPFLSQALPHLAHLLLGRDEDKPATYVIADSSPASHQHKLLRWQRFTHRYFNEADSQWIRYADGRLRMYYETFYLIFMSVEEVDSAVRSDGFPALISSIEEDLGLAGIGHQGIVMVQGFDEWNKHRSRGSVTLEQLEHCLWSTGLQQRVCVVPSSTPEDAARWIHELSLDIGYRPYKLRQRKHSEALGIDFSSKDQTSKADDYSTTFLAQLQAMHHITPGIAEAIVKRYKTWRRLYEAYEAMPTTQDRDNMLVGIEMGRKKTTGGDTDRRIGKGLSSRIHRQLTTTDEDARMDVSVKEF